MTARTFVPTLVGNARGATIVEFAIVAPVLVLLIMGLFDQLYQVYATSILNGAVQKAARDATLQVDNSASSNASLDAAVLAIIKDLAPTAIAVSTRKSYPNFAGVGDPEPFVDTNHNGVRDPGECFTDTNGNGVWDVDPGITGDGSASDVVLYTMTITYPRLFPAGKLLGTGSTTSITASTIMKNQPWANQSVPPPVTICT
jgi:Flp pilus assembly protein TadG